MYAYRVVVTTFWSVQNLVDLAGFLYNCKNVRVMWYNTGGAYESH